LAAKSASRFLSASGISNPIIVVRFISSSFLPAYKARRRARLVNPFLTLDRLPAGDTIIPFISPHADFPQFDPFHFVHSFLPAYNPHGRG